jgi:hypothetical protein
MATPRTGHTATLLLDGRVLFAGGLVANGGNIEGGITTLTGSAEIYDPATGKFSPTGSMSDTRAWHAATRLKDGRVLVVGGLGPAYAEVYDPTTGDFTRTGTPIHKRAIEHTATLLTDGRVLMAGGRPDTESHFHASAELYDPETGKFTATGSMTAARGNHIAVRLKDGRVLIAGGANADPESDVQKSAEFYDPVKGAFKRTGTMTGSSLGWYQPGSILLPDGRVLVTSLYQFDENWVPSAPFANLYDPISGSFATTGPMLGARDTQSTYLLPNGRVLVFGGWETAELYDPASGSFLPAGSPAEDRCSQAGALLNNGRVLVAGGNPCGDDWGSTYSDADLYVP